ncbi:MAG: hypothetical protein H6977_13105 [Gammaproteobacteria bacterium]|nr:hypothetical protein [Gammaproteobacteria bacterium]MCP5200946.1 hypothetical protein [Gammaproteobacteria bacterium]
MEKYYVSCPTTLEERTFTSRADAETWVEKHNRENPPDPAHAPAQVFTEAEWEGLHAPDAG